MNIKDYWFNLELEDDTEIITYFVNNLKENFQTLFTNENTSNFLQVMVISDNERLSKERFLNVFSETFSILEIHLEETGGIKFDPKFPSFSELYSIGWMDESLRYKGALLNDLWSNITKTVEKNGDRLINFANNKILKLVRKFLTYLNSLLSSLSLAIPGIEAIKELKDIAESFISIAED
nr:hypothetical protein [uncultured Draconibacterium sp.]